MQFPILEALKSEYPAHAALMDQLVVLYNQKLWHELTQNLFKFIFSPEVKGRLNLEFYTQFVKRFSRNIDQINHLKILKESLSQVNAQFAIQFLTNFEAKEAYTDEQKIITKSLRANFYLKYVKVDLDACSKIYHEIQKYFKDHSEVNTFVHSTFYRFAMNYFGIKGKQKLFYDCALQFLAYTPPEEIDESQKIEVLQSMGIALIISDQIYNFSELIDQPLLKLLQKSSYSWVYKLLLIFNQGNISQYSEVIDKAAQFDNRIGDRKNDLDQKIRLMAFLKIAFNLPKNDRVLSFQYLSRTCQIRPENVELMIMKAAALNLVKVSINQIAQCVTINWVKPKVLDKDKLGIMIEKFQKWEDGISSIRKHIVDNRKR